MFATKFTRTSRRIATTAAVFALLATTMAPVAEARAKNGGSAFAKAVKKAHKARAWERKGAFLAHITVDFGGQRMIDGTMITTPNSSHVRFGLEDGTQLLWDGSEAWTYPADSGFQGTRFHVLTWPYFLLAPIKLRDPGTHLEGLGDLPLRDGEDVPAARLTFRDGVGDTPDDWYIVYSDPDTNRVSAMAYIVTFGKDLEAAEAEPHAITYEDYQEVDGIPVPTRWRFWNWNQESGIHGEPIGEVRLSDVTFGYPNSETFTLPGDARQEALP